MKSTDLGMPLPEHLSFSQWKSLSQCGEKYLLERGYGLRGHPWWAGVGGTAVHSLTEIWDREYAWEREEEFDLYGLWGTVFAAAIATEEERSGYPSSDFAASGRKSNRWPNKEDKSFWDENGPIFVNNWIAWRHRSPWDVATFSGELACEVGVSPVIGGVVCKGSIDRVLWSTQGDLLILDLKSGGREEKGHLQLGTYAVGLREAWQLPDTQRILGCFWYARTGEVSTPVDLSYLTREYLDQLYWRADEIRRQGLFLPVVDQHCDWCKVKAHCPAFGGKHPVELPSEREVRA